MLNFRNTSLFFGLVVLLLLIRNYTLTIPAYIWLLCFVVFVGLLVYGSLYMSAQFYTNATCKGPAHQKNISLTFDDGPHANTEAILQILQRYGVSAGFFLIGKNIEGREDILRKIHEEGHVIGNHSYSHAYWFDLWMGKKMLADLQAMNAKVEQVIGLKPLLFRPPYGVTTPVMNRVLKKGGFTTIGWSIRSFDTVIKDNNKLFDKLNRALHPGAVVLMHDHGAATLQTLPAFIEAAQQQGYSFVRPDALLNIEAYA